MDKDLLLIAQVLDVEGDLRAEQIFHVLMVPHQITLMGRAPGSITKRVRAKIVAAPVELEIHVMPQQEINIKKT
ncbi:hypothetical protein [Methylomonas fluvii]|uniref:Uncharacterized protein n=1 Tax=Methylomonas fluvii TaxID=1854564 RepID=A0ABR9DL10_9GAMM|nr:hypothetical protein [Methylomonas fluvii]MBD9363793.1 hypothetical protein [Methylomonas fluvii]